MLNGIQLSRVNNQDILPKRHILILIKTLGLGGTTTVVKNILPVLRRKNVEVSVCVRATDTWLDDGFYDFIDSSQIVKLPENENEAVDRLVAYVQQEAIYLTVGINFEGLHTFTSALKERTQSRLAYWHHVNLFYDKEIDKYRFKVGGVVDKVKYGLKMPFVHILGLRNTLRKEYRYILSNYDYFIPLCKEYKDELVRVYGLNEKERDNIIPLINTIDINTSPNLNKEKIVVYVGRLCKYQKRVGDLLLAWERIYDLIPDWRLKIYGTGSDEEDLIQLVKSKNIGNVDFMGYTSDVPSVYAKASISCLTSFFEGWPMSLVEAQNNGVIPVSYDCAAGIRAIIGNDERAGRLVRSGDVKHFAKVLLDLIQDEEQRKRLQMGVLQKRLEYTHDVNDDAWCSLLDL